jgi:hypothetical protein
MYDVFDFDIHSYCEQYFSPEGRELFLARCFEICSANLSKQHISIAWIIAEDYTLNGTPAPDFDKQWQAKHILKYFKELTGSSLSFGGFLDYLKLRKSLNWFESDQLFNLDFAMLD